MAGCRGAPADFHPFRNFPLQMLYNNKWKIMSLESVINITLLLLKVTFSIGVVAGLFQLVKWILERRKKD